MEMKGRDEFKLFQRRHLEDVLFDSQIAKFGWIVVLFPAVGV